MSVLRLESIGAFAMEGITDFIVGFEVLHNFWPKLMGGALGTSAAAATSLAFAMIRGRIDFELSGFALFLAISTSAMVIFFPTRHPTIGLNLLLIGALIIHWTFVFHAISKKYGSAITEGMFGGAIGKHWVKMIDYFYLIGSTIGILRIAASSSNPGNSSPILNSIGILILSIALSLRITKTSIEVFGWANSKQKSSSPGKPRYPWS